MYRIELRDVTTSLDIGTVNDGIPPAVGDRFIFGQYEYDVTARIFCYNDEKMVIIWGKKRSW